MMTKNKLRFSGELPPCDPLRCQKSHRTMDSQWGGETMKPLFISGRSEGDFLIVAALRDVSPKTGKTTVMAGDKFSITSAVAFSISHGHNPSCQHQGHTAATDANTCKQTRSVSHTHLSPLWLCLHHIPSSFSRCSWLTESFSPHPGSLLHKTSY